MRKFLTAIFEKITEKLRGNEHQLIVLEENKSDKIQPKAKKVPNKSASEKKTSVLHYPEKPLRDVIDLMEFPFVALSKYRTNQLIY